MEGNVIIEVLMIDSQLKKKILTVRVNNNLLRLNKKRKSYFLWIDFYNLEILGFYLGNDNCF